MEEITVQKLKEKIESGNNNLLLLDVREPFERYQSNIEYENSMLIPVGNLPARIDDITEHKKKEIVCFCRSGVRSAQACNFLKQQGFDQVINLKGGINEWAQKIDNSLPVY